MELHLRDSSNDQPTDSGMATPPEGLAGHVVTNLPQGRYEDFVGRADLLASLARHLKHGRRVQIIHGLGGVGKSQAALEYAYQHSSEYTLIWWIRAETPTSVAAGYAKLAARLGQQLSADAPPPAIRRSVERLLADHRWLLIFDAASDAQTLLPLLPNVGSPTTAAASEAGHERGEADLPRHVLITSRNPNWDNVGQTNLLQVLPRDESVRLLRQRSGRRGESDDDAERLAQALGDLPLALEQAAAVIRQGNVTGRMSFADYLGRFETEWAQLMMEGLRPADYPHSVAMTWGLAFNAVESASPAAAALLNFTAFISPDRVDLALLRENRQNLPPNLAPLAADARLMGNALDSLSRFSLVERDAAGFSVHRLVAMVTRDRLDAAQQRELCKQAIQFLASSFGFNSADVSSWAHCAQLLPHVADATVHAERLNVEPQLTVQLLNDAGRYLLKTAQYAEAKRLLARALSIGTQHFPADSPKLSSIMNNLGRVHENLGEDEMALHYFGQALTLDQAAYGHAHPHVAELINNYGICMVKRGDRAMARQQFQWAAEVYEAHYGPDHPKLAHILNNLGYALKSIGEVEAARTHLLRALTIAEMSVGSDHPTTARILYNLGGALRSTGQLPAARQYLERALEIDEATLGLHHPDVAVDCTALAELLEQMNEPALAASYRQRGANHNASDTEQRWSMSSDEPDAAPLAGRAS